MSDEPNNNFQLYDIVRKQKNTGIQQQTVNIRCFKLKRVVKKYIKQIKNIKQYSIEFNQADIIQIQQAYIFYIESKQMKSLSKLQLQFPQIKINNDEVIENVVNGFQNLSFLKELELNFKKYNETSQTNVQKFCRLFKNLINLEKLTLDFQYHNFYSSQQCINYGETISKLTNLKYLKIEIGGLNFIGKNGAIGLGEGISNLKNLENLILQIQDGNNISSQGAVGIGKGIENLGNLKELDLDIDSTNNIRTKGMKAIADGIKTNNSLEILSLNIFDDRKTDGNVVEYIMQRLQTLTKLTKFEMYFNGQVILSKKPVLLSINKTITSLKTLKSLTLSIFENSFKYPNGSVIIAQGISQLKNLEELDLTIGNNNNIKKEGAKAIANSLQELPNLSSLKLVFGSFNMIETEGCVALSQLIASNKKLKSLSISIYQSNYVQDQGISELINTINQLELDNLYIYFEDPSVSQQQFYSCFSSLIYLNIDDDIYMKLKENSPSKLDQKPFFLSLNVESYYKCFSLRLQGNNLKNSFNNSFLFNEWISKILQIKNIPLVELQVSYTSWSVAMPCLKSQILPKLILYKNKNISEDQQKKIIIQNKRKLKRLICQQLS